MKHSAKAIEFRTTGSTDVLDFTSEANAFVSKSRISNGLFTASVPGSTAAITTIEYETGVVNDLKRAIEELVPQDRRYEHNSRWGDGNGFAHVRAALMKPALSIPIVGGELALGTWQQIVLCDFDNRPRMRKVMMQVIGE